MKSKVDAAETRNLEMQAKVDEANNKTVELEKKLEAAENNMTVMAGRIAQLEQAASGGGAGGGGGVQSAQQVSSGVDLCVILSVKAGGTGGSQIFKAGGNHPKSVKGGGNQNL